MVRKSSCQLVGAILDIFRHVGSIESQSSDVIIFGLHVDIFAMWALSTFIG